MGRALGAPPTVVGAGRTGPARGAGQERRRAGACLVRRWAGFGLDYVLILAYLGFLAGAGLAAGPAVRALFATPAHAEATGFLFLTRPVDL